MKNTKEPPKTIDEYIAGFAEPVRTILEKIRRTIKSAAPDAQEAIKYGIPTFVLNGNLVHFGGFQRHIGFYPTPSGIAEFEEELSVYKKATGSIQFPLDKPVPYDLIGRIVSYRVEENRGTKTGKKRRR